MSTPQDGSSLTTFSKLCAKHDFLSSAAFLAAFAQTARDLGENCTVTERQFLRWRSPGPPCPRDGHLRTLHAMFGIPPHELGFRVAPRRRTSAAVTAVAMSDAVEDGDVERRTFLGAVAGINVATGATEAVGAAHVRELRRSLVHLYELDDAHGGDHVRALAVSHLRRVRRIINTARYPDTIGRQLQLIAGEAAEHCGWLSFDADLQDDARHFWGEALTAATVIRDDSLRVLVLASMSEQALRENRPRDAYNLARAAQDQAPRWASSSVLSILAAREARALASLGDHTAAGRAFTRSMRLYEKMEREHLTPDWAQFHGPAEINYTQGLLFVEAGHHGAAVSYLLSALTQQEISYARNRALYGFALAASMIKAGEVEEGCTRAVFAAEYLGEVSSARVHEKLCAVRTSLAGVDTQEARETARRLEQAVREQKGVT